jgi:hypothetical protein
LTTRKMDQEQAIEAAINLARIEWARLERKGFKPDAD